MLPNDLKHLREDAFHEGMDWPHAVGIIAALFLIAWSMDHIERRVEKNGAAPQALPVAERGTGAPAAHSISEQGPAVAAPVLPLSHPLAECQWVAQWGPGEKPRPRCVNADLTNRGKK